MYKCGVWTVVEPIHVFTLISLVDNTNKLLLNKFDN